jgi:hypothetical protein
MAKKISSKDLFEQEDIFKGVRDSAEKTLISLNKINDEFKQTAATLKQSLGDAKFDSSDSIKKFTQATAEANKVQKQAIEIEKLKEQVRQQAIKSEKEQERLQQERIKTQKAEAQEKARLAKESEKAAKAAESEASSYSKLSKNLNDLRKKYKDLAIQNQENTAEGQQLLKQITDIDTQLKKVDATVGQHQRNVGNYEGATANLKTELRALTRELMNMSESDPKFQEMAQRAGELRDQISDTQAVVKATAGTAMETFAGSVAKAGQIGVAAFQGMESSMVLLGVENEAVLESMQKLQALAGLGDALQTLGGLGDALTEIRAGFTATLSKMGLLTAAKQADTVATVENTVATEVQTAATTAQGTATTTATGATKLLGLAMKTLPVVAIAAAIGLIVAGLINLSKTTKSVKVSQEDLNKSYDAARNALVDVFQQTNKVKMAFDQAKSGTISKEKALSVYNETLGSTFGYAKNVNEAEKIYNAKTASYIKSTMLRAQANELLRIAAEKEAEGITAGLQDQTSIWDKVWNQGNTMATKFTGKQSELSKIQLENVKKIQQENAKNAKALKDKAGSLLSEALAEEKSSNIKIDAQDKYTEHVKTGTNANDKYNESLERQKKILEELNALKKEVADAEKEYLISLQSEQKQEEIAVNEKYDNLIARAKANEIDITLLEEAKAKALLDIQKKYADIEIQKKKEKDDEILRLEKEAQDKLNSEYEKGLDDRLQAELLMADDIGKERINAEKEYQNQLDKLNELNINGGIKSEAEYKKALEQIESDHKKKVGEIDKKAGADEVKKQEERQKTIEAFAQKTTEYLKKKSDEKIAQIDKEIAAAEKQNETLKTLAAEGNINAQQSLAENQRIIDQANLRKEKQLRNQKRIEAGLAIFKLFSANADKKNPLAKTIADTTGLLAFISSLPMFYDGTEDTGTNGKGIDGKGGFHAVLHPNERVVPKSLNEQIGSMSNEQLAKLAQEYQNGRLVSKNNANSSLEMAILVNEMRDLKEVIKNKPETNIALGEITQSAMQIVESKRTGNTTIYNRFRVSK